MALYRYGKRFFPTYSVVGLFFAAAFFAMSLTPSLLPRAEIRQGIFAGVVAVVGYMVGRLFVALWQYLELPNVPAWWRRGGVVVLAVSGVLMMIYALTHWLMWQNSILIAMGQPVSKEHGAPIVIILIALFVMSVFFMIGALVRLFFRFVMRMVYRIIPRRIALFIGFVLAMIFVSIFVNDVIIHKMYKRIDTQAAKDNLTTDDTIVTPHDPQKTGSPTSLIAWDTLGRTGKNFITKGPSAKDITAFSQQPAQEPLRVYVGLTSRPTPHERAELALAELKRIHAFDRSVLVIINPTGTGWVDPLAADTLEYIHNGDTAQVAVQYSYLSSQSTIFFYPDRSQESAEAVFDVIYDYWTTLPKDTRPKLYLFGVSLGSLGSEQSAPLHKVMFDPPHGALWAGPPFLNPLHRAIVKQRRDTSPAWLPLYEDGTFIRFIGQKDVTPIYTKPMRRMRIIYIQYASDPLVQFSPTMLFHEPAWLQGRRGPDVSPFLHWYPLITFFQVFFDITASVENTPLGHGHNFSPESYIDGWVMLTDPVGWTAQHTQRLKDLFHKKQ